jgi:hypothetical protein
MRFGTTSTRAQESRPDYKFLATFSVTGASNGYQTGPFQMTITTLFPPQPSNNLLQLTGNRSGRGSMQETGASSA